MKKFAIPLFCACAALSAAELECPVYEGGLYGGASWLYLKPTVSDGDFQYGTLLTLTDNPPNLTAHMQEFRPDYQSAVRAHLGYRLPCSAMGFEVGYFHFNDSKHQSIPEIAENQFFQTFLGGSFTTVDAFERQRLNQVDLKWTTTLIYDDYFVFEPFVGVAYADIQRDMDVRFTDFLLNPQPANVEGKLRSEFWGVGPIIGAQFKHCFLAPLYIKGHLSGGALIGRIKSQTDGAALKEGENISFFARDDYTRASTMLSGGIGLTYQSSLCNGAFGIEFTVGYEVDYYFRAVDRINPSEGFFVDPNSVPVKVSSNLGLAGPYVQLSIFDSPDPCCMKPFMCCPDLCCGFYLEASAAYLKPRATNRDLTFATLHTEDQESRDIRLKPDWAWSGYYDAGYRFGCNTDIRASYMHLYTTDSKNVTDDRKTFKKPNVWVNTKD